MPILTSVTGTNDILFKNIWNIYGKENLKVLDLTYGKGIFWKQIDTSNIELFKNDIDMERGDFNYDSRNLPESWKSLFDFVVYDPPYMHSQSYGTIKNSISDVYNNNKNNCKTMLDIRLMYENTALEINKVIKEKAIVVVKCADSIEGGKQKRLHIWVWEIFINLGFTDEDLLILTPNSTPAIRWQNQKHCRKNNSFAWVFRN